MIDTHELKVWERVANDRSKAGQDIQNYPSSAAPCPEGLDSNIHQVFSAPDSFCL